jgi:hypothetical protein
VVLLGLCAVVVTATARAGTDKREVDAIADFAAGRYQQAIDLFAQLYGETMDPVYLRNIGRCQQGLGQAQLAINSFREYLKKSKGMKADERKEIEGYIKEMEAMLAAQHPAAAPPTTAAPSAPVTAAPPIAPQSSPGAPAPASAPSPAPTSATAAAPPASGGAVAPEPPGMPLVSASAAPPTTHAVHPWRVPGIVVTAVGAALIGTGVAFGLSAKNDASAVSATYDPSRADAGKRNARIGAVADIVGAAAVVTGIVLITHGSAAPAPTAFGLRAGALADSRSGLLLVAGSF